jgi:hypothetical protein
VGGEEKSPPELYHPSFTATHATIRKLLVLFLKRYRETWCLTAGGARTCLLKGADFSYLLAHVLHTPSIIIIIIILSFVGLFWLT